MAKSAGTMEVTLLRVEPSPMFFYPIPKGLSINDVRQMNPLSLIWQIYTPYYIFSWAPSSSVWTSFMNGPQGDLPGNLQVHGEEHDQREDLVQDQVDYES